MNEPRKRVCFDSSIWNAILNQEEDHDLASIEGWIRRVELMQAVLLVPSIIICEIAAHPSKEKVEQFDKALQNTNVEQLDVTIAVARNAGELRRQILDDKLKIKTPDAIVVASADFYRADFLLSVDPGILRCDGKYGLTVKIGLPSIGHDQPLLS